MVHGLNLSADGGGVLQLHDMVQLPQPHSVECTLLILGGADTALDLLDFNCCHSLEPPSLTSEYFFYTDATILGHLTGVAHLGERCDGSLYQVVGVRRALGLGQTVSDSNTLENGTHSAAGHHTSTCAGGHDKHFCTAVTGCLLVRYGAIEDGNLHKILLGGFYALGDSCGDFTGLAEAITDDALTIADYYDCCKCEGA